MGLYNKKSNATKNVDIPDVAMMTAETFYETAQQALGPNSCETYNFPKPEELRQMEDLAALLKDDSGVENKANPQ